ncbi:MAG TPA: hypothetical protein VFK05_00625, partial [Polyangiaceae bacterium]|nr:hypothetical protein [Polyangiaceae bacterium]
FHKDVEPILQRSCQNCHVAGGIAPFPLLTYAQARVYGAAIVQQTKNRTMPPWHAENTDECTVPLAWKNDARLTDAEIATLEAWQTTGLPEGNAKDAPPARALSPRLPGVQLELEPAAPFTLQPGSDQFRCFVLDPQLTKDSFVNGVFIVPGNDEVVHHALVFSDPKAKSLAKADASQSYDCFGGVGIEGSQLLTAWAPGSIPMEYPPGIAAPLSAGSLLVMQVHYHPHSATDVTSDATRVQLRFSDDTPEYNVFNALIGNFSAQAENGDGLLPGDDDPASGPEFLIPANRSGHQETMEYTIKPADVPRSFAPPLYGVGGHMHYVGVDEKVTLVRADGSTECLMQIPHWDFDWQRRYDYDAPVEQLLRIGAGDKFSIRCTYDNTMANAKVATSLLERGIPAPRPVSLGESTLDEMCLFSVTALFPAQ